MNEEDIDIASDSHVEAALEPFSEDQEEIVEEEEKSLDEMTPEELKAELLAEKARNEQLAKENAIEADTKRRIQAAREGGAEVGDPSDPFSAQNNPMLQAAEKLPSFIQGADGAPNHVQNADPNAEDPEVIDDSLGGGMTDPSTFTG